MIKNLIKAGFLYLSIFVGGCAPTIIQWAPGIDNSNNPGHCPADKACIYVICPDTMLGSDLNLTVSDNSKGIGVTGAGSYLAWARDPGTVHIESRGKNVSQIDFTAEAGQTYYISQAIDFTEQNTLMFISKNEAVEYLRTSHPAYQKSRAHSL